MIPCPYAFVGTTEMTTRRPPLAHAPVRAGAVVPLAIDHRDGLGTRHTCHSYLSNLNLHQLSNQLNYFSAVPNSPTRHATQRHTRVAVLLGTCTKSGSPLIAILGKPWLDCSRFTRNVFRWFEHYPEREFCMALQ